MLTSALLVVGLTIAQVPAQPATPTTQAPAPKPAGQAPAGQPPAQTPAAPRPAATARPSITVTVTDRQGKVIQNAKVTATGPMEREGKTDAEGTVILRNVAAGTYRLRFEHEAFCLSRRRSPSGPGVR